MTLPDWAEPTLHGLEARLPRTSGWRVQQENQNLRFLAAVWAIGTFGGGGFLLCVGPAGGDFFAVAVLYALLVLAGPFVWMNRGQRKKDHLLQVSLHGFRYSDDEGKFWELSLASLQCAEADGSGDLVIRRRNDDPLRFAAAGATTAELLMFSVGLNELIQRAEQVDAAPDQLRSMVARDALYSDNGRDS